MSPSLWIIFAGLTYAGLAVLFGLLAPALWPRKNLTRANALLLVVFRLGLAVACTGVLFRVLEVLSWERV